MNLETSLQMLIKVNKYADSDIQEDPFIPTE